MQILAFSDLHGYAPALELLRKCVKDESYDYILVAGDLTNVDLVQPSRRACQVKEIFSIMEVFKIPYYYVWGTPFREGSIALPLQIMEKPENYVIKEDGKSLVIKKTTNGRKFSIELQKTRWQAYEEIRHFLSSLKFGRHLKEDETIRLGKYSLTSNPRKLAENTIFLRHHYRKIIPKAMIQIDGHVHYGQHIGNYLNLGFLYRDATHGASPMIGCYWELTLKNYEASIDFIDLGGQLKYYNCPDHPREGTFYIPRYWKKCPVCYRQNEALVHVQSSKSSPSKAR